MSVAALRDADLNMLEAATFDPETRRRARHVITENQRTLDAAAALAKSDLKTLGQLMGESHASMRDDFEITVPAIDRLVEILQAAIGDPSTGSGGGARMTGGGFGGACVAVLPVDRVAHVQAVVEREYQTPDGEKPLIMIEQPGPGVEILA